MKAVRCSMSFFVIVLAAVTSPGPRIFLLLLMGAPIVTGCDSKGVATRDTTADELEEIELTLLANPPNGGDWQVRASALLALDRILSETSPHSPGVRDFYTSMMEKVKTEIQEDVPDGLVFWMMYNHGFLVKTPETVFAFDVIDGLRGWPYVLPDEIVDEIDVLFVSHWHQDHIGWTKPLVRDRVIANGGHVVVPIQEGWMGNVPMTPGDTLTVGALFVTMHEGWQEDDAVGIFEVITPGGVVMLHNGDATSMEYVSVDRLDVALLSVEESHVIHQYVGMLHPTTVILGHMQELNHDLDLRATYRDALLVGQPAVVMAWGERYAFVKGYTFVK